MKYHIKLLTTTTLLALWGWQPAIADQTLAQNKGCMACHAIDKKIVGPSVKDIAAKYKGDNTAAAALEAKVKNGGSGVWGPVPMPPNAAVSDADIKTLVAWMLAQ